MKKFFKIEKVGEVCPSCQEAVWSEMGHIKSIKVECDSFCKHREECQAEIDEKGLAGFRCKDSRWGPLLGAKCERDYHKFALNETCEDHLILHLWQEGYPWSWGGWSR